MELILFLAMVFMLVFLIGHILKKLRIPWVFAALFIGLGLAAYNPFADVTSSQTFIFLSDLGLYFLLFIMGLNIDLDAIYSQKKFIFKTTFFIILAEATFGSLLVHYIFGVSWLISILIALSFATIGEAVLLPILSEFKLLKTRFGQIVIGVAVLDDIVEILTITLVSIMLIGAGHFDVMRVLDPLFILGLVFMVVFLLVKLHRQGVSLKFDAGPSPFLFALFLFSIFIGGGQLIGFAPLCAIFAGFALRNLISKKTLLIIDSQVKTIAYGFFIPLFFLSVGLETDIAYLFSYPLLILLILAMTNTTKIVTCYLIGKKVIGAKKSVLLGISLSVKFSTSIIVIKLLFENNIIHVGLYSILIGTMIVFKFLVPILLSYLITKWNLKFKKVSV